MRPSSRLPPPPTLDDAGRATEYQLHNYDELADTLLRQQVGAFESRSRALKFAHQARAGLAKADEIRARSSSLNRSSSRGRQPSPFGQRGYSQDSFGDRLLRSTSSTGSLSARSATSGIYHFQRWPASFQPRATPPPRSMPPQRSMRGPMSASSSTPSIALVVPSPVAPQHYGHVYSTLANSHLPLPPGVVQPSAFPVLTSYGGQRLIPTTYGSQPHFLTANHAHAIEILGRSIRKAQLRIMHDILKTFQQLRIKSLVQSVLPSNQKRIKPSLLLEERYGARDEFSLRILLGLRTLVSWIDNYKYSLLRIGLIQFFNYDREDADASTTSSACLQLDFSSMKMPAPPRNLDLSTSDALVVIGDPCGPTDGAFATMPALPKEQILQDPALNVRTTEGRLSSWPSTPDHSHWAQGSKFEEYSFAPSEERLETNGYANSSRAPGVVGDTVPTHHRIGARLPEAPQASALRAPGRPLVGRTFQEEARSSRHSLLANNETRPIGPSDPYLSQPEFETNTAASSVSEPMPKDPSRDRTNSRVSFARNAQFFSADSVDIDGECRRTSGEYCPESMPMPPHNGLEQIQSESLHDKYSTDDVRRRSTVAAEALGITKDASSKDVTRAFFDRAKTYHPDKGGDAEDFYIVNEAYQRLKTRTG